MVNSHTISAFFLRNVSLTWPKVCFIWNLLKRYNATFLKQKNSGFKSILSKGFLLAWISSLVAYVTSILKFLLLFLRPRCCNRSCRFLLFRVAGGGLMRFFVSNSLKCFSWEFLVAFKANSNQHYS